MYLLVNTENIDKTLTLCIPGSGTLTVLDPLTDTIDTLPLWPTETGIVTKLDLPGYTCHILCREK